MNKTNVANHPRANIATNFEIMGNSADAGRFGILGPGDVGLVKAPLGYTASDDLWT